MQTKSIPAIEEFIRALEPVTCRVVQEELNAIVEQRQPEVFQLDPDSPLYDDLKELNKPGELEFVSHEEVWGERPQIRAMRLNVVRSLLHDMPLLY